MFNRQSYPGCVSLRLSGRDLRLSGIALSLAMRIVDYVGSRYITAPFPEATTSLSRDKVCLGFDLFFNVHICNGSSLVFVGDQVSALFYR